MTQNNLTIEDLKNKLCSRAKNQIALNYGELNQEQELVLYDFFDDAIDIIRAWMKLKTDTFILKGNANSQIVRYIVRTFNELGIEGQKASSVAGDSRSFVCSPADEIRNSLIQRV